MNFLNWLGSYPPVAPQPCNSGCSHETHHAHDASAPWPQVLTPCGISTPGSRSQWTSLRAENAVMWTLDSYTDPYLNWKSSSYGGCYESRVYVIYMALDDPIEETVSQRVRPSERREAQPRFRAVVHLVGQIRRFSSRVKDVTWRKKLEALSKGFGPCRLFGAPETQRTKEPNLEAKSKKCLCQFCLSPDVSFALKAWR